MHHKWCTHLLILWSESLSKHWNQGSMTNGGIRFQIPSNRTGSEPHQIESSRNGSCTSRRSAATMEPLLKKVWSNKSAFSPGPGWLVDLDVASLADGGWCPDRRSALVCLPHRSSSRPRQQRGAEGSYSKAAATASTGTDRDHRRRRRRRP
jgi:hypothetical protein